MSTPPVPILFAHNGRDWIRGSERCLLDLVEGLDRSAFTPIVACNSPTLSREASRAGARVEPLDLDDRLLPRRSELSAAWRVVRRTGARLIHANTANVIGPLLPAARTLRIPLVAHIHITPSLPDRRYAWLHQVSTAVGVARHVVAGLLDDGMPADRVRVIYNGVDPTRLDMSGTPPTRAELGIAPGALVLASVGSLISRKGHDVTVRGIAALGARGVDAHLVICGDGETEAELRALAASLGIADRVHLLGLRPDVGAVVRNLADVFVSAARDEAFPLNVLEAQFLARPVVASDIPAHHEAVAAGETGVLFRDGRASDLAARILPLVDAAERARLGDRGQAWVREQFLIDRYLREFHALYDDLLSAPASRHGWVQGSTWPDTYGDWMRSVAGRVVRRLGRSRAPITATS